MLRAVSALVYAGVSKHYGSFRALSGVSLEVRSGEVFGLLGPNGAGKTTLIRIGLDILRPDSGTVTLFGKALDRHALDRVSYLPEERGLYKKTKVIDALAYFGRLKGMSKRDAHDRGMAWLERVGLNEMATKSVDALSKGMSQKVQIVAALFSEPDLCILDEPFSGLDPVAVEQVKDLIRERRDAGLATILSTHMMNQVEAVCDRVGLIHAGELVVYGEIGEVRRAHSSPDIYVRLHGALPEVAGVIASRPEGGGHRLTLAEGVEASEVLAALVRADAKVEHFEERLASMEQIFLRHARGEAA